MKKWKAIIIMAKIGKFFSVLTLGIGILGIMATFVASVYEISTNTHTGIIEISKSAGSFLLSSFLVTTLILILGVLGFFKTQGMIEKFGKLNT